MMELERDAIRRALVALLAGQAAVDAVYRDACIAEAIAALQGTYLPLPKKKKEPHGDPT